MTDDKKQQKVKEPSLNGYVSLKMTLKRRKNGKGTKQTSEVV